MAQSSGSYRVQGNSDQFKKTSVTKRRKNREVQLVPFFELTPLERRVLMSTSNLSVSDYSWNRNPNTDTGTAWTGGTVDYKYPNPTTGLSSDDGYLKGSSFTLSAGSSLPTGEYTLSFTGIAFDDDGTPSVPLNPPPGHIKVTVSGAEKPISLDEEMFHYGATGLPEVNNDTKYDPDNDGCQYQSADFGYGDSVTFNYKKGDTLSVQIAVTGLDSANGAFFGLDQATLSRAVVSTCSCSNSNNATGANGAPDPGVQSGGGDGGGGGSGGSGGGPSAGASAGGGGPGGGPTGNWTSNPQGALGGTNGNNTFSNNQPFVGRNGTGSVVAFDSASGSRTFDLTDTGDYVARYGVTDVLTQDTTNHEYVIGSAGGSVTTYYDFDSSNNTALQGRIKSYTDAGGNTTGYAYDGTTHVLNEITQSRTNGTLTTKESYLYTYLSGTDPNAGKTSTVTLRRKTWDTALSQTEAGTSYATVRTTNYAYYGSSDSNGNLGDLKTDVLKDAGNNTIDTSYYRYYTSDTAPGYTGGLKYYLSPASYDRLAGAFTGGVTPLTATDSQLAPYADMYYEYDAYNRVAKKVAQGEGCSSCSGGQGAYEYAYSLSGNHSGFNSWNSKTIETLPDGNQNVYYYNIDGQELLKVFQQLDIPKVISSLTHSGTTATATSSGHGYQVGNVVIISGASTSEYDGSFTITAVTTDTFTYVMSSAPAANATGTVGVVKVISQQGTYTQYDDQGRPILNAQPSALSLPPNLATAEQYPDLLHNQSGNYEYLNDNSGLINITDYYDDTGSPPGYIKDVKVQRGETNAASIVEAWDYTSHSSGGNTVYQVSSDTRYRNADGTGGETTTYAYTWNGLQVQSVTIDQPVISAGQNGSGTANETATYYDEFGRTIWSKDGDGHVSYTAYDAGTGAVIKTIADVDFSLLSSEEQTSSYSTGWSTPSGGLNLVTTYQVDPMGRTTKMTDPKGNVTYMTYNDAGHEQRTYVGWTANGTNSTTTGPTIIQREDRAGSYSEDLTISARPNVTGSGSSAAPNGTEWISGIQTLTRTHITAGGQADETDKYFTLGTGTNAAAYAQGAGTFKLKIGSTTNTASSDFYATTFVYDVRGRQSRIVTPQGTIYRTVYDGLGRAVSTWVGTNDTPTSGYWSPSNPAGMTEIQHNYYDTYNSLSVGVGSGDGNLTRSVAFPNGSTGKRVTENYYDWRDRLVATKSGMLLDSSSQYEDHTDETDGVHRPIIYYTYDNLDEVIQTDRYDGDGISLTDSSHIVSVTDGVPTTPSSGALRARVTVSFDDQGRPFRTDTYDIIQSGVDAGTYATSNTLSSQTWYDARGNVMASSQAGGLVGKYVYDGAGRLTHQYIGEGGVLAHPSTWNNYSNAASVGSDVILQQTDTTYDANGNTIAVATRQRFHNDATNGAGLGSLVDPSANPKARVSYQVFYYDPADRLTDSMDVGTNGGTAYTRPTSAATVSSETLHLTHTDYNAAGWADTVTDARGIKSKTVFDMLGRSTRTIAAWDSTTPSSVTVGTAGNQVTDYTYDGDDHVLTQTAWNKSGTMSATFQTTKYVYGVTTAGGSGLDSNDILAKVQYPDKTIGNAGTNTADAVLYKTDALGEQTSMTDRNGSVHAYGYDPLGRLTSDTVTLLASGVEGSVRRLGYSFDTAGRPYQQTSYSDTAGATIVNQVQDEYNGLGQMTREYQNHSGAVDTSTSYSVQYAYSEMAGGANHSRLIQMSYPNPRLEGFVYNSGLDDAISRVSAIGDQAPAGRDGDGGMVYNVEEYTYLGLNLMVEINRVQEGVALTYIKQTGDTLADTTSSAYGGDQYTGLDRFGQIVDQNWINTASPTTSVDRFQHAYDRGGNALYEKNAGPGTAAASFSMLFHANASAIGDNATAYDNLNRLTGFRRGVLSVSGSNGGTLDTVSTVNSTSGVSGSQSWSLDAQGNQSSITTDGTTVNRGGNSQNQITSITGQTTPVYDANGNMTTDENGHSQVYDAWNRLMSVSKSETFTLSTGPVTETVTAGSYAYDAQGRRITESATTGSVVDDAVSLTTNTNDLYFDSQRQVIQENTIGTITTVTWDEDLGDYVTTTAPGVVTRAQYLWSLSYVNDLVERDYADNLDTAGYYDIQRVYTQHDANHNVTSVVDHNTGNVLQRIVYDAYGLSTTLDADWAPTADTINLPYGFQGGRYDANTGLYVFNARDYDPSLGTWREQDSAGYVDGANLYQFVRSSPSSKLDPQGLCTNGDTALAPPLDGKPVFVVSTTESLDPEQVDEMLFQGNLLISALSLGDRKWNINGNLGTLTGMNLKGVAEKLTDSRFVWVRMSRGTCNCGKWDWGDDKWYLLDFGQDLGRGDFPMEKEDLAKAVNTLRRKELQ